MLRENENAISSALNANAAPARILPRRTRRPTIASANAPVTAPSPTLASRRPYVRAVPCSVSRAITGISTRYGMPKIEYTVTMLMSSETSRDFRMKRMPSINPSVGESAVGSTGFGVSLMRKRLIEHQQIAQRIHREAPREPEAVDDHRREARPRNARQIESARIQCNRIDHIVASHQLHHQRLSRGDVERARRSAEERDPDQHRDRHVPGPVEPPEQRRLAEQQRLRDPHERRACRAGPPAPRRTA